MKYALISTLVWGFALAGCSQSSGPDTPLLDAQLRAKDAAPRADADDAGPIDPPDSGIMDADLPDADPLSTDLDHDGLPDGEDPDPVRPNAVLFSDTFETNSEGWLFSSVGMQIDTGRSLLRVPRIEPLVRVGWPGPRQQWADIFVRALIRVTDVGSSNEIGTGRLGVLGRTNRVSPGQYVLCGLDMKTHEVFISEHDGGHPAGDTLASAPLNVATGEWVRILLDIEGAGLRCTVAGVTITAASQSFLGGSAGFRAFDAAFDADWFEVYDR